MTEPLATRRARLSAAEIARRSRVLMKGNEAIAEAAIQAGCDAYFGYPITPQAELLEWMARRMPELGRAFVQAESELGAINMALGAAATGARVMVSSSSPGISLMAEGMSYMAGSGTPMVLVNVMRAGPGLGSIGPAQSDYFQATKGHGHGDYHVPVLAPASISEAMDLVATAFELAERYRTPVMVVADGILGQAMEPVELRFRCPERKAFDWALSGAAGRPARIVKSIDLDFELLEKRNVALQHKYAEIARQEVRWAGWQLEDAEYVIVAYGTAARVARSVIEKARARGIKAGLFRPITLWPFPSHELRRLARHTHAMLVVELSSGQMVEDVRLAVEGRCPVAFHGRMGGLVPTPDEVLGALKALSGKVERTREREREQQQKRHAARREAQSRERRHSTESGPPGRVTAEAAREHAGVREGGER
jgi:2-oxoglutarate ferredoxin oxidoreductase subunit alpha